MRNKDTVTRNAQVLDILPGDPPRILTGERLSRGGKPGRLFQQMIPVLDADLFSRLTTEVCKGDTIRITVLTEWDEKDITARLADFALLKEGSA